MKIVTRTAVTIAALFYAAASYCAPSDSLRNASPEPLPLPAIGYVDRANMRSEFMSYTIRQNAASADRDAEWNYLPVENYSASESPDGTRIYSAEMTFPEFWADRIIIVHTEGGRNSHRVFINGQMAGSARDSGTPSEFELQRWARQGVNSVTIEVPPDTDEPEAASGTDRKDITSWFFYSQPRTRIWDYTLSTRLEGDDGEGIVEAEVVVRNDHPSTETFTLCFDVFSPAGRVEEYGYKEITLPANSSDTLHLSAVIYGAGKRTWSASSPNLYTLTLFIRKGDRIVEYVPVKFGFGDTAYSEGNIYRNGKPISFRAARYNATDPATLEKDIAGLKKEGYDTLWPDYPQPCWFYDICDASGMYVIDRANIHTSYQKGNMRVGGCLSNDPAWLPEYMERTRAMFMRSRNHPCIVAWSLGGDSGNGYNMYKTYICLHEADLSRPVVYPGAGGEWNSDNLPLP